ncbi:MAG TPA: hypothetical protein ENH87_05695 [Pricia antarctica]|uniref:Immunity MXAN-0049 protein domain-containing protein n=1 Tax=Pricia antarctica TaxID=641691 RepID=A0A831QNV1_9FLAO|nr:hypothetical protein [Pricia antarctica]
MRYFSISSTHDLGIIGKYPQTMLRQGYDPTSKNSSRNLKYSEFPDFLPELELEIDANAVPTNFLERAEATFGIIVDTDFREILEQFTLPHHHFYPIKVYHKGNLLKYFWLHFIVKDIWKSIDIEQSLVRIQNSSNANNRVVLPIFQKEYLEKLYDYFMVSYEFKLLPEKIVFNDKFENLDLVNLDFLHDTPLISVKLKNALEEGKMNGFETKLFKPLNATKYTD